MKTEAPTPETEPGAESPASPRLERIVYLSRAFRLICRLLMALVVLAAISVTVPQLQRAFDSGNGHLAPFLPTALLVHAYFFAMAWLLERMFNAFVRRGVFDSTAPRYLKWLGILFISSGALQFLAGAWVLLDNSFHTSLLGGFYGTIGTVILGAFILMSGWILEEACELREQQRLTV